MEAGVEEEVEVEVEEEDNEDDEDEEEEDEAADGKHPPPLCDLTKFFDDIASSCGTWFSSKSKSAIHLNFSKSSSAAWIAASNFFYSNVHGVIKK